ncbi:MAG: 16S rRNA (cytosine(1402)-N(4))-methyltransferase RsmH, partial [Kiritimatiellae bacterium]|nr:16S rRNA (cytosine(1402)-N(4))-methyltransferase RsmH [Kiritimatiellia bacterium]
MHLPVMLEETVDRLNVRAGGVYLDCTVGDGGHSAEILRRCGGDCRLLALDRDAAALERASARLREYAGAVTFARCNHADAAAKCAELGFGGLDGAVIDTGVSSEQLDEPERGFSFRRDGPLDMRMDCSQGETASDIVATWSANSLAALFRDLGEEPDAARIAAAIVRERENAPIATTGRLADVIAKALGPAARARRRHPATRVFQALRMRVNRELESLDAAIGGILPLLGPGGRLAVITFESISDRLV